MGGGWGPSRLQGSSGTKSLSTGQTWGLHPICYGASNLEDQPLDSQKKQSSPHKLDPRFPPGSHRGCSRTHKWSSSFLENIFLEKDGSREFICGSSPSGSSRSTSQ